MARLLLDTSAWVEGAERFASTYGRRTLVASTLVLGELASLAERGRVSPDLVPQVLSVARVEEATLEDALAGGRLHGRLRKAGSKASLTDCIVHATARRLGESLLTCDADLAGQPGVVLVR